MKKVKYVGVLMSILLSACSSSTIMSNGQLMGSITAVGSSAMQPLVEVASDAFQEKHPEVLVNVQGGGSGQGLSQIVAGTVEIGNSDVFAQEKKIDLNKYNIKGYKVAAVGIAPIVNFSAKVENVSKDQLIDIFTGKISNWKEVGGADLPIVVINRASGSGSRSTFEQFGLNNQEPITAQEQDNTGTVRKLIQETAGAISYVSFPYLSDKYQALSIDGVKPSRENVESNQWTIWAYQHMYTSNDQDPITQEFMTFMMSDEVQQEIVPELGYIPVTSMKIDRDEKGNITVLNEQK